MEFCEDDFAFLFFHNILFEGHLRWFIFYGYIHSSMYYALFFILLIIGVTFGGIFFGTAGILLGAILAFMVTLGLAVLLAYLGIG